MKYILAGLAIIVSAYSSAGSLSQTVYSSHHVGVNALGKKFSVSFSVDKDEHGKVVWNIFATDLFVDEVGYFGLDKKSAMQLIEAITESQNDILKINKMGGCSGGIITSDPSYVYITGQMISVNTWCTPSEGSFTYLTFYGEHRVHVVEWTIQPEEVITQLNAVIAYF